MSVSFEVYRGGKDGRIVADTTTRTLQPNEAYIETTHSGLCGTDEHFVTSGQVLGHEGVGIVRQIGSLVSTVKVGDRVGFGYIRQVCGACDNCATGWDQFCRRCRRYGETDLDLGSFSHGVVWDADCLFPIPEGYTSEHAAPMLCAGGSVWNCLLSFGARPPQRVGVMGIGGLGHLAIKLAAAMGYEVVALSRSEEKRADALAYGASEFHVWDGEAVPLRLKHLLLCGSMATDYAALIPLMDTGSIIYPLTVAFEPAAVPILEMGLAGICIQGVRVSSRTRLRELLVFAANQHITPTVVSFPLTVEGVERALSELRAGNIHYRAVLVREPSQ
ncbi:hypothetical protein ASPZODRAFT_1521523 [Penicilliopsis zonata CBS 506.65]|uniref:Alcohol dehydrogenase-like N-terminal domain-containing protein n=1 Tax=Penicilliopsis zonata CBS 506.65 TaxID=1073090 RepID=A0A1L9SLR4_9EURO|nr:hypothetical protein ASPZODRAFT_1521523 [Penicilliopsis zonata CBS 506.65]OJJ48130.1 hypothetical protein ASPZODRAFT_1521523 [Penicilliopsis zonata CBS 506.65]